MCVHGDEETTLWLTDVFLIVFMAQRKKRYQAVTHTQYLLVDTFTVGLNLNMKKYVEYHQTLQALISHHSHSIRSAVNSDCRYQPVCQILTSTVDHVVFVGSVQRPAVVLAVVQVMPATRRTSTANTHLETTQHT